MTGSGERLVVIGRIGRPHGLTGETRAFATGPTLGSLGAGDGVSVLTKGAPPRPLTLTAIRSADQAFLISFAGVSSREEAGTLTGGELAVPESVLAPLDEPDEFYVRDLIGCVVFTGDAPLGTVSDIYAGAANDALIVRREGHDDVLVPFTRDAIVTLDVPGGTVRIRADLFGDGA